PCLNTIPISLSVCCRFGACLGVALDFARRSVARWLSEGGQAVLHRGECLRGNRAALPLLRPRDPRPTNGQVCYLIIQFVFSSSFSCIFQRACVAKSGR